MNDNTKQVTIYCASSNKIPQEYFTQAEEMTRILVEAGYGIRYGGGEIGLMGVVANTALKHNGHVTGIIPHFMSEREWEHKGVSDMIRVDTMHQRKELLIKDSCAVIALAGGTGTLDELFDVLSLKKLGQYPHPVILLNTNDFYRPLIELAERMADEKFIRNVHLKLWTVISSPKDIIKAVEGSESWDNALDVAAV